MRLGGVLLASLLLAACSSSEPAIDLKAAFSDETVVGRLSATWRDTGDGGVDVRLEAVNQLADGLYLELRDVRLIGPQGPIPLPSATACTVPPRSTRTVLSARVPVAADAIRGFDADPLAIPLSERGRAFYREFLLRKRGGPVEAIDTELAQYTAAPPCP